MKPDWPKGYGRKGAALHKLKRYDEAAAVYNAGLEACPGDKALTDGLATVIRSASVRKINMMQQNPQSIEMMLQVRTGWFSKVARNISVQLPLAPNLGVKFPIPVDPTRPEVRSGLGRRR